MLLLQLGRTGTAADSYFAHLQVTAVAASAVKQQLRTSLAADLIIDWRQCGDSKTKTQTRTDSPMFAYFCP